MIYTYYQRKEKYMYISRDSIIFFRLQGEARPNLLYRLLHMDEFRANKPPSPFHHKVNEPLNTLGNTLKDKYWCTFYSIAGILHQIPRSRAEIWPHSKHSWHLLLSPCFFSERPITESTESNRTEPNQIVIGRFGRIGRIHIFGRFGIGSVQ